MRLAIGGGVVVNDEDSSTAFDDSLIVPVVQRIVSLKLFERPFRGYTIIICGKSLTYLPVMPAWVCMLPIVLSPAA